MKTYPLHSLLARLSSAGFMFGGILTASVLATARGGEPGKMTRELWTGIPGGKILDFTSSPRYWQIADSVTTFSGSAAPANIADNYASRTRAVITAPVSGNYVFWLASDDDSELYLSTSASKFDRVRIASVSGWTNPQAWDTKTSQKSAPIALVAGQKYFVEILQKESNGGDHSAIAWQPPGAARSLVPAAALESFTADLDDADNDDLPDSWEATYGFSLTDNGTANPDQHPLADPDHDGYSNLEESRYGTDPNTRGGYPGTLLLETWNNIPGGTIKDLTWSGAYLGTPDRSEFVFSAATPANRGDSYGSRLRGYVIAPVSGSYTFYIAGDDDCQLRLSTSGSQFAASTIATQTGWSNPSQWTKFASQKSAPITLAAGAKYYIEALQKENGGGDHLEIGWKTPSATGIAIIPGSALESYALDAEDPDGDNMPSAWEIAHGLDPVINDAALDPDKDGIPNALEYSSDTDPQVKNTLQGGLVHELWSGIPGYKVKELTSSPKMLEEPQIRNLVTVAATVSQPYDAFGSRLRGYLTAPTTGSYTFWVRGDDETELWLSPTSGKFGKQLLARPTLNTDNYDTDISQKSRPVTLQAGQSYYIEILHKDYYAADYCSIAWTRPGAAREEIPGSALTTFIPTADDMDDDDLPDAWEIANGLSATDNGRINPKNGAQGDLDGDGLTNAAELAAGTRADLADTDGDGVSDFDEILLYETQALSADAAPFQSVVNIPGAAFTATSGAWIAENGKAVQDCVRGWVDYPVTLSTSGVYQIALSFTPLSDTSSSREYEIVFSADGTDIGRQTVTVAENTSGSAKILTPWLAAGTHNLRIFVDNSRYFRRVTLDNLQVLSAQGPDANSNGTPDWIETRTARTNSIEAPSESLTSPVCLEGKARWSALTTLNGIPVQLAPDDRWFANVSLNPTAPTAITASLENGAATTTRSINWIPTNLLTVPALSIRQSDALKLTAFQGSVPTPEETVTLTVEGVTTTQPAAQPIYHTFTTPGSHTIQITHSVDGNVTTATSTITVVAAPVMEDPVCVLGYYRQVDIPALPPGVSLQLDNRIDIRDTTTYPAGSKRHTLRLNTMYDRPALFRLGGNSGPVIAPLTFKAMRVRTGGQSGVIYAGDLPGGIAKIFMPLLADGLTAATTIQCELFIGGVTFDDGTITKILSTSTGFESPGYAVLHFLKSSPAGSVCHRLKIFQNGTQIAYYD